MNVIRCAIWYHLHNLKNVKNTHQGVFLLVLNVDFSMDVFHVFWIVQMVPNFEKRFKWMFFKTEYFKKV